MRISQHNLATLIKAIICILLLPWAILGCDGGGNGADIGNDPPLYNITGRFRDGGSEVCRDQFGNRLHVPPTDAIITQTGNSLTMIIERSGHRHTGRVSGDGFFVTSTINAVGERCEYQFSGSIFSDDYLAGVETIDCTDGSSGLCPGTVLRRAF